MKTKQILALLLSLLMILSMAACSGSPTAAPAPEEENPAAEAEDAAGAEAPAEAGPAPAELTIGLVGEPNTMDPRYNGNAIGGLYESLFAADTDFNIVNVLATGYEWEDDTTLVVTLREGVKFHNGEDFTASDVLYSLAQCAANPQMSNRVANILVDECEARDDYTVAIKTKEYSAVQINYLTTVVMLDENWTEASSSEMGQVANGTGPLMLKEWNMGSNLVLEANPNYWGEPANFETITIRWFSDPTTAFLEYETGNLDVVEVNNAEDVAVMKGGSVDGYMVDQKSHHVTVISMGQLTGDTFASENLRQAIYHALDIETMITAICGDMAIPANSVIPSDDKNHIDIPYAYDPELAAECVDAYKEETGAETIELNMIVDTDGYNPTIAEAIQAYLADVGITMNVETCMKFDLIPRMIAGEVEFTLNSIGGGADSNDMFMALERGSGNTVAEFTDNTICDLIVAGKTEHDDAARSDIYKQIQQLNADGAWTIPLYEPLTYYAARDEFQGVHGDPVSGEQLMITDIYYAG